jgi:tripartite-type tricarboxylate transporter receptor subunit TctC
MPTDMRYHAIGENGMGSLLNRLAGVLGLLFALTLAVAAQDYPVKPVRIIVPFAPGGINDLVGRLLATHLTERLGKQVIVENRSGAGGVVGSELVANAPKDGHTLLIASIAHAVNPSLYKLPYHPVDAFAPVAIVLSSPNALAVNRDLPVQTLKEFVALAKQKPGELQYASGGVGGSLHLGFELFKATAGIDLLHVPFRGAGPAIIDVTGGHTQAIIATITTIAPHVRGGRLRALAVSGTKRNPILPDVPTMEEGGVAGYEAGNWIGIVAPAGTPTAIVDRLHREISAIQELPEVQKQIAADGAEVVHMSPAGFGAFMGKEMAKWDAVIKRGGIKAE